MKEYKDKIALMIYNSLGEYDLPRDEYNSEASRFLDEFGESVNSAHDTNVALTRIMAESMGWELSNHEMAEGIFDDIADEVLAVTKIAKSRN